MKEHILASAGGVSRLLMGSGGGMVPLLRRYECSGVSAVQGDGRGLWTCFGAINCLWEGRLW